MLEANLDDMTGETLGYVMTRLLDAGAFDVFFTPIQMKKNRPASKLSVLVAPVDREKITALILAETSTLGVRYQNWHRTIMKRTFEEVETPYGAVHLKIATYGKTKKVTPEYADCAQLAQKCHIPLTTVYQAALQARKHQ